jgi:hypothetical protein
MEGVGFRKGAIIDPSAPARMAGVCGCRRATPRADLPRQISGFVLDNN